MTIDLRYRIQWTGPTGTVTNVESPPAGASEFAELVRVDVASIAPQPSRVGRELARVLGRRESHWPSRGATANVGPWSRDESRRRFFTRQGRGGSGRYRGFVLLNSALNASGRPYAGYVDQGIVGPNQFNPSTYASAARRRANTRAVLRTWRDRSEAILEKVSGS
ncbi:hypothetical protein [Candidatus Poriferisocius sp.]|uniref:hypothetical protein n=1 Tax=Candidatus Poriferisocius sp. TaxID=3101276 RepID=UPI003B52A268